MHAGPSLPGKEENHPREAPPVKIKIRREEGRHARIARQTVRVRACHFGAGRGKSFGSGFLESLRGRCRVGGVRGC